MLTRTTVRRANTSVCSSHRRGSIWGVSSCDVGDCFPSSVFWSVDYFIQNHSNQLKFFLMFCQFEKSHIWISCNFLHMQN
jgi:hypothetical protein